MIGTHNSMTYLPPKNWWMYPFRFIAKCQSKDLTEQYYKYGVRIFDLRIAYDEYGCPEFRHGSMIYKGDVYEHLQYLNSLPEKVYVRLILEKNGHEDYFIKDCKVFEDKYPNIIFFQGNRKSDWKKLYTFKQPDLPLTQMISSMTWKIWDDWWPWLYARIMNKKNRAKYKDAEYLLLDFIEI